MSRPGLLSRSRLSSKPANGDWRKNSTKVSFERDRQGIRYFAIRDPEGNQIEVVEEA
jgi:hypothetical protein